MSTAMRHDYVPHQVNRPHWGEGEAATTVAALLCLDSRPECADWAAAGECTGDGRMPVIAC